MDRTYIESERIVDRYLAGELTVREAREFEKYCLEHPQFLNGLPIPVRLKARLARRPLDDSETGMFPAIPSSTTHAALRTTEEDEDEDDDDEQWTATPQQRAGVGKPVLYALAVALLAALGGVIAFGMRASALEKELREAKREVQSTQMQAPGSVQAYRLQLRRAKPSSPTLTIGWPNPPQLLDFSVEVKEGNYNTYQITIDKVGGGRVMQIRRVARDSNKELRFALNSSAFGPGDYLLKFDGYTWRGQPQEVGWVMLGLQ
jgi:hypothetical protein